MAVDETGVSFHGYIHDTGKSLSWQLHSQSTYPNTCCFYHPKQGLQSTYLLDQPNLSRMFSAQPSVRQQTRLEFEVLQKKSILPKVHA